MKKSSLLLILILITFSGCYKQDIEVTRVKESCVTPDVNCDFRGSNTDEILGKLLECISDLKKSNEVCK